MDIKLVNHIRAMHSWGVAPSEIDKRLCLPKGTAHGVIVESWAADWNAEKTKRETAKEINSYFNER